MHMTHTRRNFSFFKMIIFMRSFFKMTRSRRADHFEKCILAPEKINDDRYAIISRSCAGEIRHFSKWPFCFSQAKSYERLFIWMNVHINGLDGHMNICSYE
jgi:hypothetical protein